MIVWNYVAEEQAQDVRVMGNIICCVTERPERSDRRKLRREKRQSARGRLGHMERYRKLGRKAIRKVKAIERELGEQV